ncbi:MAG: hypothetical protein U5O39_11935 [Gammaproteobacteria bacterium]|nr:hypothetical protein [Gammaproteobacteria bacterium]
MENVTENTPALFPISVDDPDTGENLTFTIFSNYTPISASGDENPTATNTVTITGTVDQVDAGLGDFTFPAATPVRSRPPPSF